MTHNIGDMLFSRKYGLGTVIEVVQWSIGDTGEPITDYRVEWHGGMYGEGYIQQIDSLMVGGYKKSLVLVLDKYTTGGVVDICRWEKERLKA